MDEREAYLVRLIRQAVREGRESPVVSFPGACAVPDPKHRATGLLRILAGGLLLLLPISFGPGQECHPTAQAPATAPAVTLPAAIPAACATVPGPGPTIGGLFGCATTRAAGLQGEPAAAP
ncbi:MAG: hypothetical protein AB1578_21915 [Thermodesulfobacteriota bacterium]